MGSPRAVSFASSAAFESEGSAAALLRTGVIKDAGQPHAPSRSSGRAGWFAPMRARLRGYDDLRDQDDGDAVAGAHSSSGAGAAADDVSQTRWCPEERASWAGRLLFRFADGLIARGSAKHLEQVDLWHTAAADEPAVLWSRLRRELAATTREDAPRGVVWRALWRVHARVMGVTAVIKIVHDAVMFLQPLILEQLLRHLSGSRHRLVSLGLAVAMLFAALLEATTINVYFYMLFRVSLHTKAQLLELLYRKALALSGSARSEMGVGPIVNLQSNDAAKLWSLPTYGHMLWNAPMQICIVMTLLVRKLTLLPALAGVAVTVAIVPMTMLLGRLLAAARREAVSAADARVKLVTEVITGIKAIKLYAWEEPYARRIHALRETELAAVRRTQLLGMINSSLFTMGPVLVSLAAFSAYSALGHTLTADVAFPALVLFNLLRFPLIMLPQQIMNLVAASVGFGRLQGFLGQPETTGPPRIDEDGVTGAASGSDAFAAGTGVWGSSSSSRSGEGGGAKGAVDSGGSSSVCASLLTSLPVHHQHQHHQAKQQKFDGSWEQTQQNGSAPVVAGLLQVQQEPQRPAVCVRGASFAWARDAAPVLRDVSLELPAGALVAVVGPVGAGKSSLLAALLGELEVVQPQQQQQQQGSSRAVELDGAVAYAAQDPWIQNASLRANVLMGAPFDAVAYEEALDAACLGPDLQLLPAGDATEIGEKGINLSGGQRARVALARVVYAVHASGARIALLDDPLSAVDAHVGRRMWERCLCGALRGATRVLVTHQMQFVPGADIVVVMLDGRIAHIGTPAQLAASGVDLAAIMPELPAGVAAAAAAGDSAGGNGAFILDDEELQQQSEQQQQFEQQQQSGQQQHSDPHHLAPAAAVPLPVEQNGSVSRSSVVNNTANGHSSNDSCYSDDSDSDIDDVSDDEEADTSRLAARLRCSSGTGAKALPSRVGVRTDSGRLVFAETRARGRVSRAVYRAYLSAWGPAYLLPLAVLLGAVTERGLQVGQNYVLALWSNAATAAAATAPGGSDSSSGGGGGDGGGLPPAGLPGTPVPGQAAAWYLGLYVALGLCSVGVALLRSGLLVMGSVSASRALHAGLLTKLLRLPLGFFDSQPTGRLINRFTKDTESLDASLAGSVASALTCLASAGWSVAVVLGVSPWVGLALLPLTALYYRVQAAYINASRELKRLDALAFSPIFQHYQESLAGLATLRAFGRAPLFADINRGLVRESNRAWWPIQVLNRWLSMRLEVTGACVVFSTAVAVGVAAPRDAGLAGLALSAALNLTGTLAWLVRQTTELEVNMNSVERLVEYAGEPEEAPAVVQPRPPRSWPRTGRVTAVRLEARYRPGLPAVLRGLSFDIKAGEKVGVCGRTGCGKSTLMLVLFRLLEPSKGALLIDGLDTARLGLTDLRSRLSLVPQDPVIFSGSVRTNLDPWGDAGGDDVIWAALRAARLDGLVRGLGAGLDSPVAEGGSNLSAGQRQLLALARALLRRRARVLLLDEATSSVDGASDAAVQSAIRSSFEHCTVITIAHRLHTIADADRVMVLDAGRVAEFDSPAALAARPGGAFARLLEEAARCGS